jgi:hypothetical protein
MPRGYDPYNDPYSDRIGELIRARGDIAARGALESGDIWGRGIQNIAGQLGAGVQQYAQQREQKRQAEEMSKRDAVWTSYIESGEWQKDPNAAYGVARKIWGPKAGEQMAGLQAVQKMATEGQAKPNPEQDAKDLGAVAGALMGMAPGGRARWYPVARAAVIKKYPEAAESLPEQYDSSVDELIGPIAAQYGGAKKEEGFTLGEGQVRYGPGGEIIAKGPEKAPVSGKKYEVTVAGPGGQPIKKLVTEEELAGGVPEYQKPETDIEARQIRAEERRTEREKEKAKEESLAVAKESDTQVKSAFSAMEQALGEMEKYSGMKAMTSPLEAANARQQYEAAAQAFAATLSRATGDTRISDLDRRAYAGLLAYTGGGSTLLNITRPDLARKRLDEAKKFFGAAAKTRQGGDGTAGGGGTAAPTQIQSVADYEALPAGAEYIDPNGQRRRKGR